MTIWIFIKHAEILREGVSNLSSKGKDDSLAMARSLPHGDLSAIYSSPSPRCIETVCPLSRIADLPVIKSSLLRERKLSSALLDSYRDAIELTFRRPAFSFQDGESINSAKSRLLRFLAEAEALNMNMSVASTHGVNVAILMNLATQLDCMQCWKSISEGDCVHFDIQRTDSTLSIALIHHEKIR